MFDGMGHAGHSVLVAKVADIDVEGSASLVRLRVMDEEGLEAIVQADNSVISVVEGRLL